MLRYFIGRVLGMLPTLAVVLVGVFGAVNLVPALAPVAEGTRQTGWREANEVFRRQFGLDLPVFLNLRPWLSDVSVLDAVRRAVRAEDDATRLSSREWLEDQGRFAVPALLALALEEGAQGAERGLALDVVRSWAKEAGVDAPAADAAPAQWRRFAREIEANLRLPPAQRLRVALLETRFGRFLHNLFHLDFGVSMKDRRPVLPTLLDRLGNTLFLSATAVFLSFALSVPLGAWLALARGRRGERLVSALLFALYSLPTYVAAALLVRFFCLGHPFDWFPVGGLRSLKEYGEMGGWERLLDRIHHAVLPLACLTYGGLAVLSRYARESVRDALAAEFVRLARAKGLSERVVLLRHALRNGVLPLLTLAGEALPAVFGGSVIVEILFEIPGMGTYVYEAILSADYNAVLATTLFYAVLTLAGFLLSDLLYALFDPRVRERVEAA